MPQELPEMIQLLITKRTHARGRSFVTVMNQFTQRMPIIHSTDKKEFFIAYFLGGVYNFQYTQLKTDLQVTASFWKWGEDENTLDFVFEIENRVNNNNSKHLVFRSITVLNENSPYAGRSINQRPYADIDFKDVVLANVAYKQTDHAEGLRFKEEFYSTRYIPQPNRDSSAESERKLLELGFEKIQFNPSINGIDEGEIQKFSLGEAEVERALKSYLTGNVELFKEFKPIFSAQAQKALTSHSKRNPNISEKDKKNYLKKMKRMVLTEAFSHGFLYGSLSLNFKNRYRIDCYVERIAGNGYTDLMMTSRTHSQSHSVPIIIELKTGTATAREAITQIENKGYFQHVLSLRTYHESVIIAGVNFNLANEETGLAGVAQTTEDIIFVRKAQIPAKNDVIGQILESSMSGSSDSATRRKAVQKSLMDLYYSRFGKLNFRSFVSLLMGYVISYGSLQDQNNNLNNLLEYKKFFLLLNDPLQDRFAMLVIDVQGQGVKKTIVFELNAETGARTRNRPKNPLPEALAWLGSQRKSQQTELHKISIKMDATKTGADFFSSIDLECINLASFNAIGTIDTLKEGNFHELKTLIFSDFFTKHTDLFDFSSILKDKVQETLFPLRSLFQGEVEGQRKESVFQAALQGMIAGFNQENHRIRVFVEPNYSAQGRADLVVALPYFNAQKELLAESLFIFELKALVSNSMVQKAANMALDQARKYSNNLKALSDTRTVALMGLVMNSQSQEEHDFLTAHSIQDTVEHISTDERLSSPERSPNKRNRVHALGQSSEEESPPKRRRCQRSVGIACYVDFSLESDESMWITDLAEARQRGHVILLADQDVLLLALVKVHNPVGKIFVLDENVDRLNQAFQMLVQAQGSETIETYLQTIQPRFPKATRVLEEGVAQLGDRIDFGQFKNMLLDNQLVLIKINELFRSQNGRQALSIGNERIAAIGVDHYEHRVDGESSKAALFERPLFKERVLSLLSSQDRTDLYRRRLPDNKDLISIYSGSKDYLEQAWQPAKRSFFSASHEENLHLLKSAQDWYAAIKQFPSFSNDWIPILESAREGYSGQEKLHFLHVDTHELRIVELEGISSTILRENLNLFYENMGASFSKKSIPEFLEDPVGNIESVDALNMAFAVQAIFDFAKTQDRAQFQTEQGPLYTALQVHHYLNLAQMAHSTLMDVNKVVDIVKTLLREEIILIEKPESFFQLGLKQGVGEGLAVLFGVANVVLDSIELHAAKTEQQKVIFSAQLAFDTGSLSLPLSSLGAAALGSTTTAAILGAGSVIFSGMAIGIMALVQAFESVASRAEAVGNYFYRLDEAYQRQGYTKQLFPQDKQPFMSPIYGAVVTEINFVNDTLYYGSPYIYAAIYRAGGSGRENHLCCFVAMPDIIRNKSRALNIRERLSYPESKQLGYWKTVTTWILPSTPISYLGYGWTAFPGATSRHDGGFSVLRKLEAQRDFHYDFYSFPSEFIIDKLRQEIIATSIKVILDEHERMLVVPNFSEHDNNIYSHLNYRIEAPAISGRCSIVLNRMGSLTLLSQQTHYTWVLVKEDFSVDSLRFTETGVKIAQTVLIKLLSPHKETCLLVDKNLFVFAIDWPMKQLLLRELHFPFFKNNLPALKAYVASKSFNTPIKLKDFPIHDHQKAIYNGTAYYSSEEDPYIYTLGIPKAINEQAYLVGCVSDGCYFVAADLLWCSNLRTHQLEEKYLLYPSNFINFVMNERIVVDEKDQLESVVIEKDSRLTIIQVAKNAEEKIIQRAHYHLIQRKLILHTIENDQLAQIFINTSNEDELAIYLSGFFNRKPDSISVWNDYPEISGRTLLAEMGTCIKVMSLSETAHPRPIWLRKKNNQRYQLINPRVEETQLSFLGSLLAADGSDVFYFYLPAQRQSPAQLFRQTEKMAVAIPLDLSITQAHFSKGMLFILTAENIIKNVDTLGETSIVSFNTAWIQTHAHDWWEKIPALLMTEKHLSQDSIRLYGLRDRSGKALAVWYKPDQSSFVMMHPPMKATGESFYVSYLAGVAGVDFFFCDNGILYQQASCSGEMSTYFHGTQLQRELPPLVTLADSLQSAYFDKQRLWLNQKGAIFSLDPTLPRIGYLEKIAHSWFQDEPMNESFLRNRTRFIRHFKSKFRRRYERSDLFRSNFSFSKINFSDETLFITHRKKSLIPIMLNGEENLWWNPNEDTFFYNPFKEDISDWRYLGVCSDLHFVAGACFFSPKSKALYFNPDYQHYQGENFYFHNKMTAELAMSHQDVFLCVLDQVPPSPPTFFPLFRDKKNLSLYISNESAYTFDVPQILLNHYHVTFYQSFSLSKKTLIFPFNGEMEYKKNGRDISFFGSTVTGQWTFLEGMQDETWNRTIFDITRYDNNPIYFFLKKARECLSFRNGENVDINGFFILNSCLRFESEESLLLSGDFSHYAHQSRHHHEIQGPRFVERRLSTLEKAPEMSTALIISSLSAILGVVVGSVYCVLTRRFRQNNPGVLPVAAVSIPLLSQSVTGVSTAEASSLVVCREALFKQTQCVQNESSIGFLGYCDNGREALLWLRKPHASTELTVLFWDRLGYPSEWPSSNSTHLDWQVAASPNYLSFIPDKGCRQRIDLRQIQPVSMALLFPYLPSEAKQWLQTQWSHEEIKRNKRLQDEVVQQLFKQSAHSVGLNYFASECLLHTSVGDFLQLFGLRPHWRDQDHRFYSARCLTAVQQLCWGDKTHPLMTITSVCLETALLHPKLQAQYFGVSCKNSHYAKQATRFLADLLQFGYSNFAYLPSVLEFLFSDYALISMIAWGLRAALSLFSINNDPSYYYLGMALFLLPQLPLLLEHLGIPVTHYVSQTLKKLTQFFIVQSLIVRFTVKPDLDRLVEQERALVKAEQRVDQGRQRLSHVTKSLVGFFNRTTSQGVMEQIGQNVLRY